MIARQRQLGFAKSRELVLIDGSALAYRSYFAFSRNPLVTSRGENTSAVYGFTNSLLKILNDRKPDLLGVAFDTAVPTFRHEIFPDYKSTRAKMPDELGASLPRIDALVNAMRVAVLRRDGVEADDIIGTVARRASEMGIPVFIHSGDKDFCQLVTDRIHILRPRSGGGDDEVLDADGVVRRLGVPPDKVVDLLALMGDSSDNVPGVPGVGEKTALRLIQEHRSLDAVLDHAHEIPGKLGERLREHREIALLSRRLVTIRTDVDLDVDVESLRLAEPDRGSLSALFRELEFRKLAEEYAEVARPEAEGYRRVRSLEELDALLERLRGAEIVAVDTETTSLNPLDAKLVGVALSGAEGESFYIPLGHHDPAEGRAVNLPFDAALARLRAFLEDRDVPKCGQHTKYDASVLLNHGVRMAGVDFDTMLAAYLLEPGRMSYGLDALALQELNHKMITYQDLVGGGRDRREIWDVEIDRVTEYAGEDADITLRLRNRFAPRIAEHRLTHLFEDVEMPLSEVLMRMERHGVLIDRELFEQMSASLTRQLTALESEIHALAGHRFNVNSPAQLRAVLFEELKLPSTRRTKTGASTDSDVLERLVKKHPIAAKILDYRQVSKLLSTYVDALPKLVRQDTGRVHTSFNQTVAATGRLSSSDPNLQNIPIRTEIGRQIRAGFVAPGGWRLLSADYNQVELRILASICGDEGLRDAFRRGIDVHRHTAGAVFDVPAEAVTSEMRARAKAVNFGIIYGQGARGLAAQLGISVSEAETFIQKYFDRYADVKRFKDETLERARRDGYVTTLLGRRRYLAEIRSEHGQQRAYAERMAVNTVIQGTAADLIKVAMVQIARRMEREGLRSAMILQVHDELLFEVPDGEGTRAEAIVREEMEGAIDLDVPVSVDAGFGRNWLEAH
jgi:DNA polymerase-1